MPKKSEIHTKVRLLQVWSGIQGFVPNPDSLSNQVMDLVRIWPKGLNFTLKSDILQIWAKILKFTPKSDVFKFGPDCFGKLAHYSLDFVFLVGDQTIYGKTKRKKL